MTVESATATRREEEPLLRECMTALRRAASYRLPPALDQRMLWLSENKESLSETERSELMAMVELAEERTLDKAQARALLSRLVRDYPHLSSGPS